MKLDAEPVKTPAAQGPKQPNSPNSKVASEARQRDLALSQEGAAQAATSLLEEGDEDGTFIQRRRGLLIFATILVSAICYFVFKPGASNGPAPRSVEVPVVRIQLPPPLPPPPPPPPPKLQQPPPPEEKMEEQVPMQEPEVKPEAPQDKPKAPEEPPDGALGTGIKGDGPGMAGLGASGSGGGTGLGSGSGGNSGSKWGWYAGQVQARIAEAMRANRKVRGASLTAEVRVWPDSTGRVTRAEISRSTGDAALDASLKGEILTGLQLQEPPPAGMRLPITLRLMARRP